ncbi:MAG: 16S rRNA (uracil(1498)-N(3))-methyltransferase [Candidatus Melainabacteria bacterium]|nr:16S rRNA (uracil(1498)-N(3))-methyltransferase [Candidatus Melainabacteria bacterium]
MHRFFLNPHQINWQEKKATISDVDHTYKISRVLRLRENDQVVLLDGNGLVYNAQIASFYSKAVQCRLLSRRSVNTEPDLKITIAQSLLKGPKYDYALQKNTEIGVCEFIPVTTERTVIKPQEDGALHSMDSRIERYQKIVRDAAEQSERGMVPIVKNIISVEELCKLNLTNYDLKLVCLERSQTNGIKEILNSIQDKIQKVLVLIGPEGGFTEQESKHLLSSGFTSVSLGKRIYRAETVGIVISSILFFSFSDLK